MRTLGAADIVAALRLTEAAGWNQKPEDWQRVLALEPEGCFGIDCDGALAATGSVVCYGRELAWIGMVLTLPEYRSRGFARAIMERAIEYSDERGVRSIKLDATDMGRPLYLKLGFRDECVIERWVREPNERWPRPLAYEPLEGATPDLALDKEAFGVDRSALLSALATGRRGSIPGAGYIMSRPGRVAAFIGPCVARTPDVARRLIEWAISGYPRQQVFWDLLPDNSEALHLARELGFTPLRRLVRMVRGEDLGAGRTESVYAGAGFEYG